MVRAHLLPKNGIGFMGKVITVIRKIGNMERYKDGLTDREKARLAKAKAERK